MSIFSGKTAMVTGAGSGIGRALALELARFGASVAITDLREDRLAEVLSELKEKGAEAWSYRVDHSKREEVEELAKRFFAEHDHLDILCSNAGVGAGGRLEELTLADWELVMNVNLWGAIYMLHYFAPKMIERREGKILITASGAGLIALPAMAPYCASKFAMVGLAESLRIELIKHNIQVSALCPGIINTNIVADGKIYVKDESGASAKSKVVEFYKSRGADPALVARDGLKALARDVGIMPSPLHMWPLWIIRRLSPSLYEWGARLVWKKGWLL